MNDEAKSDDEKIRYGVLIDDGSDTIKEEK
jgi:hypothetical protein